MTVSPTQFNAIALRVRIDHPTHGVVYTDVAIPLHACFADVLDGLFASCEIPLTDSAWVFTTAMGHRLPNDISLGAVPLIDGDLVCMSVVPPPAPPALKDSAQALADVAIARSSHGFSAAVTAAGCLGWLMLVWRWREYLSPGVSASVLAFLGLVLGVYFRVKVPRHAPANPGIAAANGVMACAVSGFAALAAWWSASHTATPIPEYGQLLTAVAVSGLALVAYVAIARPPVLWLIALATVVLSTGVWMGSAALLGEGLRSGAAMVLVLLAIVNVMMPRFTLSVTDLRVHALPTTGEPLPSETYFDRRVDYKAALANEVLVGSIVGQSLMTVLAVAMLATKPGALALLLLIALLVAGLVQAVRLRSALAGWAQGLSALAAGVACAWVTPSGAWAMAWSMVALATFLAMVTAPLYAHTMKDLEPPTVRNLERLELAAVVCIIPTALYVAGVFTAIRGLG